jgi:D-3-phosphoglycerate dehydrogenase
VRTSVLAVGDSYFPAHAMQAGLASLSELGELGELGDEVSVLYRTVDPAVRLDLPGIHEHQGDPDDLVGWLSDESILVVHAAPVTRHVLEARPDVRLVVCLRGGAVNIDLEAATDLGVAVTNTPGKNAESVADLTLAFTHLLLRGVGPATAWVAERARSGDRHLDSTFVGGQWMAREPRGLTLGLVGLGAVGRLVAGQARTYGMTVLAHDPYAPDGAGLAELVGLEELARRSDVVSIHAKATPETHHLVDESFVGAMKPGSFLVNTARQGLVDEDALLAGLHSGHLAGAALDVCEPDGRWPELCLLPNVLLAPHLGGATSQTQQRGLDMALVDIRRFLTGEPLVHRVA